MKACIVTKYGGPDVLSIEEVPIPVPKDNEVLIRVKAAGVGPADQFLMSGMILIRPMIGGFFSPPKNFILGVDVAGVVQQVGKNITKFKVGDEVHGDLSDCGFGAYAEYACATETALALKPAHLSFEEAAAAPTGAVTALNSVRDRGLEEAVGGAVPKKVWVNGASGGVGTYVLQLVKQLYAGAAEHIEVTATCSASKIDFVRSLGADICIDYATEDVTKNGVTYDLIIDCACHRSSREYLASLTPTGSYVIVGGNIKQCLANMMHWSEGKKKKVHIMPDGGTFGKDLTYANSLLVGATGGVEGKVRVCVDAAPTAFSLDSVADAMKRFESHQAQGRIVLTIAH